MPACNLFSRRVDNLVASPIREILAVIDRPGMISFAGGLPAAETFPELDAGTVPRQWLQYGPSEGEPALRECIRFDQHVVGREDRRIALEQPLPDEGRVLVPRFVGINQREQGRSIEEDGQRFHASVR